MAGHILQHLAECNAHAVILVPGANTHWFPMAKQATIQCLSCLVRTVPAEGGGTPDGPWWLTKWVSAEGEL